MARLFSNRWLIRFASSRTPTSCQILICRQIVAATATGALFLCKFTCLHRRQVAAGEEHRCPLGGEGLGDCTADGAARSVDDSNFVVEQHFRCPSFRAWGVMPAIIDKDSGPGLNSSVRAKRLRRVPIGY